MNSRLRFALALWLVILLPALALAEERYKVRPLVQVDRDDKSIEEPKGREDGSFWEFFDSAFFQQAWQVADMKRTVKRAAGRFPARNINVMDEVPDSSWYTNRIVTGRLSPADVLRGQNENPPPAFDGEITVKRGKLGGITPGFVVKDRAGVTWFLKFDPPDWPEIGSSTEVITSRIIWASGFNVPELWIASFRPEQLRIDPKATVSSGRSKRKMTQEHLDRTLRRAARHPDGTYRVVASRELPGKLKGGFGFYGMRSDDPNDLIPHEHRRELRALRVLCAWVNHNDVKPTNTVSSYVEENGRKFLRHYLWDFGSALGSDAKGPNSPRNGYAYVLDYDQIGKSLLTLGIWQPSWAEKPSPVRYRSVGRFDSETFEPEDWRPNFHTYAFENMMDSDAYWATRIVAAFSEPLVRAAVRAGQLSDREAEAFLIKTLMERRARILQRWFTRVTPLGDFVAGPVKGGFQTIQFTDLGQTHGLASADRSYTYQFFITNGKHQALAPAQTVEARGMIQVTPQVFSLITAALNGARTVDDRVVHLELRAGSAKPVRAYFVFEGLERGLRLVGMEHRDRS